MKAKNREPKSKQLTNLLNMKHTFKKIKNKKLLHWRTAFGQEQQQRIALRGKSLEII